MTLMLMPGGSQQNCPVQIALQFIVRTLGVVLGTVGRAGAVESDNLVTENKVARRDILGDSDGPGVVVCLSELKSKVSNCLSH